MNRPYTTDEVKSYFQVSEATIYRWVKAGAPFQKYGSKLYVEDMDALKEWLKDKGQGGDHIDTNE